MPRTFERGDILQLDLEPTKGKEQRGQRPVFVLSPATFNRHGLAIVLPITRGVGLGRGSGFAAPLSGAGLVTDGVVLCDQPRTVDPAARNAQYIETAPSYVVDDVLARLAPLVT